MQTTAASTDTAVVRLEHVGKRYGVGTPILSDISLSLDPGGFCLLTGASGAGKTMLLRMIPSPSGPRGRLMLFGTRYGPARPGGTGGAAPPHRHRVSGIRRRRGVERPPTMSRCRCASPERRSARSHGTSPNCWPGSGSRSGPTAGRRHCPAASGSLSRSPRRRGRPELLIADEPTGNVDEEAALLLARMFQSINRLGTTVLIATRDIAFARHLGERRLHLDHGMLSADVARTGASGPSNVAHDDPDIRLPRSRRALPPFAGDAASLLAPWLVALMVYVASLGGIGLILVDETLRASENLLSARVTVQVPAEPRQRGSRRYWPAAPDPRRRVGASAEPVGDRRLLEPWLGSPVSLEELPVPRLIDVGLDPAAAIDCRARERSWPRSYPKSGSTITAWLDGLRAGAADPGRSRRAIGGALLLVAALRSSQPARRSRPGDRNRAVSSARRRGPADRMAVRAALADLRR